MKTSRLNDTIRPSPRGELGWRHRVLSPEDFPMIEKISCLNIRGRIGAFRSFYLETGSLDRGSQTLQVRQASSGLSRHGCGDIQEAAPDPVSHLRVRGVRQVRLMDMIQCLPGSHAFQDLLPPSRQRPSEYCARVSLATREISPPEDWTDRFAPALQGPSDP